MGIMRSALDYLFHDTLEVNRVRFIKCINKLLLCNRWILYVANATGSGIDVQLTLISVKIFLQSVRNSVHA